MRKQFKFICIVISVIAIQFTQLSVIAKNTKADSAFKENFYMANMSNLNTVYTAHQHQAHEQKRIFGWIVDGLINWVAGWFAPTNGYGKWDEGGHNDQGPYFLFDKGGNLPAQLTTLRTKITNKEGNYFKIYKDIYDLAGTSSFTSNCDGAGASIGAQKAKASAFVFLVGLKPETFTDTVAHTSIDSALTITDHGERWGYMDRAFNFLMLSHNSSLYDLVNMNNNIDFWIPFGIGSSVADWFAAFSRDYLQYRAKDLMMMVQALDMLKWCHNVDAGLYTDWDKVGEVQKNLKKFWVAPMHRLAQMNGSGLYSAHNNLTLIQAASIGAAAVELNDQGDDWMSLSHWPKRWANSAIYNIDNTMWYSGFENNQMSTPNDLSGFAEGPHYFRYSFESLMPFFIAKNNYNNFPHPQAYYSFLLDVTPKFVPNFYGDPHYDHLYQWYFNITQPDDAAPAYDDTYHQSYFNGVLALTSFETNKYHFVKDKNHLGLDGVTGLRLDEDYLTMLHTPSTVIPPDKVEMLSGNYIVRGADYEGNQHYFHLLAEQGTPTNGSHEHDEPGSFIIGVKDKNDSATLLAIDPPYFGDDSKNDVSNYNQHNVITINDSKPDAVLESSSFNSDITVSAIDESDPTHKTFTFNYHKIWTRDVEVVNENNVNGYYYILTDRIKNPNIQDVNCQININANGNTNDIGSFNRDNGVGRWTYPCYSNNQSKWGLKAVISCSDPTVVFDQSNSHYHGDKDNTLTANAVNRAGHGYVNGEHTRMFAKVPHGSKEITFTTYLYPEKCNSSYSDGFKIKVQDKSYFLVEEHKGEKRFRLKPDIVIEKEKTKKKIVDTKWKLLDQFAERRNYNITQADMYQLYAYGKKYTTDDIDPSLVLLYPSNPNFSNKLGNFIYEGDLALEVIPFDFNKPEEEVIKYILNEIGNK